MKHLGCGQKGHDRGVCFNKVLDLLKRLVFILSRLNFLHLHSDVELLILLCDPILVSILALVIRETRVEQREYLLYFPQTRIVTHIRDELLRVFVSKIAVAHLLGLNLR